VQTMGFSATRATVGQGDVLCETRRGRGPGGFGLRHESETRSSRVRSLT
jgi:hypothetical protein